MAYTALLCPQIPTTHRYMVGGKRDTHKTSCLTMVTLGLTQTKGDGHEQLLQETEASALTSSERSSLERGCLIHLGKNYGSRKVVHLRYSLLS
jgi:hypothetical protein